MTDSIHQHVKKQSALIFVARMSLEWQMVTFLNLAVLFALLFFSTKTAMCSGRNKKENPKEQNVSLLNSTCTHHHSEYIQENSMVVVMATACFYVLHQNYKHIQRS